MATTTNFAMTMDGADTSFPQDGGTGAGDNPGQAIGRYETAGLRGAQLRFPTQTDSFNTPFIKFNFLDALGSLIGNAPIIHLRMPSVFNISSFSDYSRTEQIVGAAAAKLNTYGGTGLAALSNAVESSVINMAEAIQYSLAKGVGSALGFLESAGLSGINQFEFTNRQAINPMSQMLYKGPQYRKYQVPVPMRPRNRAEAKDVQDIIKAFRVASSPSYSTSNYSGADATVAAALSDTSFTFGYPHLVTFNIEFYRETAAGSAIQVLYKSKPCVLDAVTVDYGGQKLSFFEDGIPTEMNLNLQMTEITPRTLGDEMRRSTGTSSDFTIF